MSGCVYNKLYMVMVFFLMFIGVNLTFFPLHFAGLHGYPRKYLDYPDIYSVWNVISSYGSLLRVFALFMFIFLLLESFFRYRLVLSDNFYNRSPEYRNRVYVFGHRYQSDVYFRSRVLK